MVFKRILCCIPSKIRYKMKYLLNSFISFFWPTFFPFPPSKYPVRNTEIDRQIIKYDIHSLDLAKFMYLQQRDRIQKIESKSIIFTGFFVGIIALTVPIIKNVFLEGPSDLKSRISASICCLFVIYLSQSVKCSINALVRASYDSFDETDFVGKDENAIALNFIRKIKNNYDVINAKVNSMTLAQDFAKKAVDLIIISAIATVIYLLGGFDYLVNSVAWLGNLHVSWIDFSFYLVARHLILAL